jgi:DNA-binding transcriptional ArsR family regulator
MAQPHGNDDQDSRWDEEADILPLEQEEFLGELFIVVSHVARREILRLVGGWEKISFTDLIKELNLTPGTFYYHLKKMPAIVEQDEEKLYKLTRRGLLAYKMLEQGESQVMSFTSNPDYFDQPKRISISILQGFFKEIKITPRMLIELVGLLTLQVIITNIAGLGFFLLFFDGLLYVHPFFTILEITGSLIIIWISVEIFFFVTRGRKSKKSFIRTLSFELLLSLPLCLTPLFIFPAVLATAEMILPELASNEFLIPFILVFLQLITAYLLLESIQVTKAAKSNQAVVPVFIILYISSSLAFLLG